MNATLLLTKCIVLLVKEQQLNGSKTDYNKDLINSALELVKVPESSSIIDDERSCILGLRDLVTQMISDKGNDYSLPALLMQCRQCCGTGISGESTYKSIDLGLNAGGDERDIKTMVQATKRSINDAVRRKKAFDIVGKAHRSAAAHPEKIGDLGAYVEGIVSQLEQYRVDTTAGKDPRIVGTIDMDNASSLEEAFTTLQRVESREGIIATGWKLLNTALQGGFRPGEFWVICALAHSWKTGFTLSLLRHAAIYSKPHLNDPTKIPLLLRLTFEDNLPNNMRFVYESVIMNRTGQMPDMKSTHPKEAGKLVMEEMEKGGYKVKTIRINSSDFTMRDLENLIIGLEIEGFEVKLCILDAAYKMSTAGCDQTGPQGGALIDLFSRIYQFFNARGIVCITPHQLSPAAKELLRDGSSDFVKAVCGKGYFRGAKSLDTEPDGILYIHIEKYLGKSYLTVQIEKHRGVPRIHDDLKYFVLPFPESGPVLDDFDKPYTSGAYSLKKAAYGDEEPAEALF